MKLICTLLALAMLLPAVPVQALDLSIPEMPDYTQVASARYVNDWQTLNYQMNQDRDRTSDTIALVVWGLFLLAALTHQDWDGNDGVDGVDGEPGPPGPPGPPGGCR